METRPPHHARSVPFAVAVLVVVAAVLVVFGGTLTAGFVRWDDLDMIVSNPRLHPPHWAELWTRPTLGLYTPLAYSLQAILTALSYGVSGQLRPGWFHATNLLLHLLAGAAVWRLLCRVVRDRWAAGAGAALFLLHPIMVEPVAWASSLNTLLAAALGLWALVLATSSQERAPRVRRARFAGSTALFALALLAKPSVCALPLALLAVDRLLLELLWRTALVRMSIWSAVATPFVIVGRLVQQAASIVPPPPLQRVVVAADSLGFYLLHWLIPWRFSIDYGRTPETLCFDLPTASHVGLALLFVAAAAWQWRRRPAIAAALLIVVAGTLPVLGLVTFDFQYYSTVADRYTYISTLGPALLAAVACHQFARHRHTALVGVLLLGGLAVLSYRQTATWHDTMSLMGHTLEVNPQSIAALDTLGYVHAQAVSDPGLPPARREAEVRQALALYGRVLQLRPRSMRTRYNLGNLLLQLNRPSEAIAQYEQAAQTGSEDPRLHINWGIACWQMHDPESALKHFDHAISLEPALAEGYANKAVVLARTGRPIEARQLCEQALRLDPRQPQATRLLNELDASH